MNEQLVGLAARLHDALEAVNVLFSDLDRYAGYGEHSAQRWEARELLEGAGARLLAAWGDVQQLAIDAEVDDMDAGQVDITRTVLLRRTVLGEHLTDNEQRLLHAVQARYEQAPR